MVISGYFSSLDGYLARNKVTTLCARLASKAFLFGLILLPVAGPLQAQGTGQRATTLEEIVVTARKRDELLTDVPISIATVSGEAMRSLGISQMQSLSESIPNLFVAEATTVDVVGIRGIHSGFNFGFEQTVGQVVDGFFFGRSRLTRVPFVDVERIEVLRGPQGALIGKNTTAGAINMTTAKPTDEFTAWADVSYENFEDAGDGVTFEGAVSGPLMDSLKGRIAFRTEQGGGWQNNLVTGEELPDADDWMVRASLAWDITDDMDALLQWTHSEQDRQGSSKQILYCSNVVANLLVSNNFPVSCGGPDKETISVGPRNGQGNFERYQTDLDIVGATLNWKIGDHTLTSLTGYATFDGFDLSEGDRSPLEAQNSRLREEYEHWTQELRWTSPTGGNFEYIAGFYYQHKEVFTPFAFDIDVSFSGMPPVPFQWPQPRVSTNSITDEEGDTYAFFGEFTWNITDQWSATVDGRYTKEDKEASQLAYWGEIYSQTPIQPVPVSPLFQAIFGLPPVIVPTIHFVAADRSESNISPGFTLRWRPDDNTMLYGSIRRGFKGGGFNHGNADPQSTADSNFEYNEEEVTSYEIGSKLTLLEGAAQLNIALFRMEFEDLQVATIDLGTDAQRAITRTRNAASATSQGVEMDVTWQANENLRLGGALGYNDAKYDEYRNVSCFSGQTVAQGCNLGPNGLVGNGGMGRNDDFQNLDGKQIETAPEWSATVNAEQRWGLSNDMTLTAFAQWVFRSGYFNFDSQAPLSYQDAWSKFDARLTLSAPDDRWYVSIIGKNLTDELTKSNVTTLAPILESPPPAFTYQGFVDPGRSVILQGGIRF